MKKYAFLALAFVLTTTLLVGCGCTNRKVENTSEPTVLPTNEEIWDATENTTRSTTEATRDTQPTETIDTGNGPLEDMMPGSTTTTESTGSTENTVGSDTARSRTGGNTGSTR